MHTKGKKPPNQAHTSAGKPKAGGGPAKGTMGTRQVKPKARGAMGKNQQTGSGGA
jgi:hypothetical protein